MSNIWFTAEVLVAALLGAALVGVVLWSQRAEGWGTGDLDALPFPVWVTDRAGRVLLANAAMDRLGEVPRTSGRIERGGHSFEVSEQPMHGRRVFCALPMDRVTRAETALRDFRNVMGDTFAQLEQGLGLFDPQGQLQMFNPALADLTGLPTDFLIRRPTLGALLDALRDRGIVPEPKDWRAWRQRIIDLAATPAAAPLEEAWLLPGGVTYRATLRPYARGALALLVEDISTELIRSRRYQTDMGLALSVLDRLDEGIAVFAGTGQLVLTNDAYADLWGHDPGSVIGEGTIAQIATYWRDASAPSALWSEIEDFIAASGERVEWAAQARLRDGRLVACRIAPLPDGATLASFRPVPTDAGMQDYRGLRTG